MHAGFSFCLASQGIYDFTVDELKKTRTVTFKAYKLSKWQELLVRLRKMRRGKK